MTPNRSGVLQSHTEAGAGKAVDWSAGLTEMQTR
jgi:hypothetical protein